MLSRWIKSCFCAGLVSLIIGSFITSTNVQAFNGPHKLSQNECDVCHIPHHAADDMLWARATTGPFTGVKRLCYSCHGKGYFGAKDIYNIFNEYGEDVTYDHVMGQDASIDGSSIIREDWAPFPLKEKEGGDGFYCGSCHDPHIDPYEPVGDQGGGDYLRQETADLIKNAKDKENSFCNQCHKGVISGDAYGHGSKRGCYDCHHPHNSKNPGSNILISPLVSFTAVPNCRGFSDSGETASACYGCHREGSGFDGALGAPLAGDDLDTTREHHPMGIGADASTSGHQPTQAGPLSPSGELYCASCHTVHDGTNDHYLNPRVVPDFDPDNSGLFCIACHSTKTIEDLGPWGEGHHQGSPDNQCLFCHSIHNAPNDPDATYQTDEDEANQFNASVSVDVIMRIAPENLAWSDKKNEPADTRDYEDACYGCHYRQDIVGSEFSLNEDNALLRDNVERNYFSHRFDAVPSASIKLIDTFDDGLPIVSDGQETETINDYGVEEGRIWCGSCHNVHRQNPFTAEKNQDYKKRRSAYLREDNYGSSLCYSCHTSYHEDLGGKNHPQDVPLRGGVPPLYYQGYSGGIGGITNGETAFDTAYGNVVCQTCHSVHTAKTNWDGGSNEDDSLDHGPLLVNALDEGFCRDCHSEVHGEAMGDCLKCHSPHDGIHPPVDIKTPFISSPNVPSISDDPNDPDFISSYLCYACHQPHHLFGDESDNLQKFGAAPIYGDLVLEKDNTEKKRNHHPMGTQAKLTGGKFIRASGAEATKNLNKDGEITCISCHADIHGVIDGKNYIQSRENNFLRWDFTNDNAEFCIKCHSDKVMGGNQTEEDEKPKHFWNTDSPITRNVFNPNSPGQDYERPVSCRQCMFCHFIHDGEERDNEIVSGSIRADMDALMRIGPANLAWGDKPDDTDLNDYEDMCYGCHSNESIVGGVRGECNDGVGSLLKWSDDIHTHRFASAPDPNNPPNKVIKYGGTFPLSDGTGDVTKNDYGTIKDRIFCGTCHSVHDSRVSPYLNHRSSDLNLSPYAPYSFCEECHDAESDQLRFVHNSHPIDKGPNPNLGSKPTYAKWPELYYTGGSGCRGGVTYGSDTGEIICLTCHNVHAAATNWKGGVSDINSSNHGKLLVRDYYYLCSDCHI
ncbi:MAG: hypothetical protein ACMUIU_07050 [bacterium]